MNRLAPTADVRPGYTLMEVLIASVLIATLMAACWNLMGLYSSLISAGREEVIERQLARSLFQLISDDTRRASLATSSGSPATLPDPRPPIAIPVAAATEGGGTSGMGLARGETMPDLGTFLGDATVELVGSRNSLKLTFLSEPLVEAGPTDPFAGTEFAMDIEHARAAADVHTILYHVEEPQAVRPDEKRLASGLHRVEVDAFELQSAFEARTAINDDGLAGADVETSARGPTDQFDQLIFDTIFQPVDPLTAALDDASQPRFEATHDYAPEVVRCEFEFYDGTNWISAWNSRHRRAVPHSIRVTLWLISSDELLVVQETLDEEASRTLGGRREPEALPGIRPRRFRRVIWFSPATQFDDPSDFGEAGP